MMWLNGNEKELRKKMQKDVEIPEVVQDRINQAYYLIECNTVSQKAEEKDSYYWLKLGGKVTGGIAAILVVGLIFCIQNPVMAKNIPVVGSIFELLQDKVSFFGNFADHAISLENLDEAKTEDGMTIRCSEVFANSQAIYVTMQFKSDEPFLATDMIENKRPDIELDITGKVDFNNNAEQAMDGQVEGRFLDDDTYACILRYDLANAAKDDTEYQQKYNEMVQQVLDEMGVAVEELKDETQEGYTLLEEFNHKVAERRGECQKYIKNVEIPDTFTLHLDITKVRGYDGTYEEAGNPGYYEYNGEWSFDIPVTIDDSQTEVLNLNETNDAGIGLKTVIRTPYELTVNELYDENADSDCFIVLLDADGTTLPYVESNSNCSNFAIQDRDISTVDIYFLDYEQYMTELKKQQKFDNPTKEDGQKWKSLLEKNAKYHKTVHFDR